MTQLLLQITKAPDSSVLAGKTIAVDTHGLSIGRADSNDLVLTDDASISKQHAIIQYQDGHFYIYDTSTNGVYLGSEAKPLNNLDTASAILVDQEVIRIGSYTITVNSVTEETNDAALDVDSLLYKRDDYSPLLAEQKVHSENIYQDLDLAEQTAINHNNEFDLEDFLKGKDKDFSAEEKFDPSAHFDKQTVFAADPVVKEGFIPERHYNIEEDLLPKSAAPTASFDIDNVLSESTPPAVFAPVTLSDNNQLETLLTQLGLHHYKIDATKQAEIITKLAHITKFALQSMVDSLHHRQENLQKAGINTVIFKSSDNNPLFLSANASEALGKLLFSHNDAYLPADAAIKECFSDLENYQDKLNVVAKQTVQENLENFAPEKVSELLQNVEIEKGLFGGKKLVNFEAYVEYYKQITTHDL